jgi:hypothetical protein
MEALRPNLLALVEVCPEVYTVLLLVVKDSSQLKYSRSKWWISRSDDRECGDEGNGDGSVRLVVGPCIARATCSTRFQFSLG